MLVRGKFVILRPIEQEDIEIIRNQTNDPWFESMVVGWSFPRSCKEQQEWFSNYHPQNQNKETRLIIDTIEEKCLGLTGLINIDWKNGCADTAGMRVFDKKFRCKGIATDSYMALFRYAFDELRLNRINASALIHNTASLHVLKKVGFMQEGIKRQAIYKNGHFIDQIMFGILKEDYYHNISHNKYWSEQ